MRKLIILFASFAFLASPVLSAEEEGSYQYSYARLSYVKGDVFIERAGDMGYEEGVVNLPVVEGDKMGTREGRAEIHFGRKNYLRIDSYTQLDFVELPKRGNDAIKLHLMSGSVFLRVSYLDEDMSFEVHTPDASFYIVEAGLYRFEAREERETELFVYEGAVEAAGEEGSLLVESEQKLLVSNGYFGSDPADFYGRPVDSFSQWNSERDNLLSRPVSSSYLPEDLNEYEEELADNGRWVYERPYGYVWVPYVVHDVWRPYYYGRWSWYPLIGWTWVSYDPWGWCVTHYGRWHWRWGLGWYWIPTRVWGPAWVHWSWGYDYIGWCPLSYYGHPVVVMNNYFYGHHYGRYYPARSRALTVVSRDRFQARRISRVAWSRDRVSRIEKMSFSAKQPSGRHRINSSSLRNSTAARVLSRDGLRSVKGNYSSGKRLSASRLRSTGAKDASRVIRGSATAVNRKGLKEQPRRITDARKISSRSSGTISRASGESASRISRRSSSESRLRTYPSRKSTLSRSNAVSSSERRNTVSSREGKSRVDRSASRTYPSRIKSVSRSSQSRDSGSTPSRSSNLRRSSNSRIQSSSSRMRSSSSSSSLSSSLRRSGAKKTSSVVTRRSTAPVSRSSAVRRSSSGRSSSPSSRSISKSVSSRRSSASSSRVSSSRSGRSSSSRVSRSSSRSSSSRSSSSRRVKKK